MVAIGEMLILVMGAGVPVVPFICIVVGVLTLLPNGLLVNLKSSLLILLIRRLGGINTDAPNDDADVLR